MINVAQEDLVEGIREWTHGRGADVVIDDVGGDVLALSIDAAKPTGVIVAYGFTGGTQVSFDIRNFFFAQKRLRGTMASDKRDLEYGLSLAREGKVRPLLDRTAAPERRRRSAPAHSNQPGRPQRRAVALGRLKRFLMNQNVHTVA